MTAPPLIPILAGDVCIGHVLERGPSGFEAFDAGDQSLGLFATASEAIAALIAASSTPEDAA